MESGLYPAPGARRPGLVMAIGGAEDKVRAALMQTAIVYP
jgi:hypothetical protein